MSTPLKMVQPSPEADATGKAETAEQTAASQDSSAVPASSTPSPESTTPQGVEGAEGIKEVVAAQNKTIGDFVHALDRLAIQAGDLRVSVWDVLVLMRSSSALSSSPISAVNSPISS